MSIPIGAIADDFTVATDLANTLVAVGMSNVQLIGTPYKLHDLDGVNAVVVALKSRTAALAEAMAQSRATLAVQRGMAAQQVIFKYCSTFDSKSKENIGPDGDALLADLEVDFTLVRPAHPGNERMIYKCLLFVDDLPLAESSMNDLPLTPMRHSNLIRLMEVQSDRRSGLIPLEIVRVCPATIEVRTGALRNAGFAYGVADALVDDDLRALGAAVAGHRRVTGGSGVALGLPENFHPTGALGAPATPALPRAKCGGLVIAGSCSVATRRQIAPGVPWTETLGRTPVALALKSKNFGGETFFEDAFGMLA